MPICNKRADDLSWCTWTTHKRHERFEQHPVAHKWHAVVEGKRLLCGRTIVESAFDYRERIGKPTNNRVVCKYCRTSYQNMKRKERT